jgi:hypothetical protein
VQREVMGLFTQSAVAGAGERLMTMHDDDVTFDSRNLSTGTYFSTLVSGDYAETRTMVIVK